MLEYIIGRYFTSLDANKKMLQKRLSRILGFVPYNMKLYQTAFLHKSLLNEIESTDNIQSNERMEYLGDAILNTIVAEYLFKKYPNKDEGFLTKMRSRIVKRRTLNIIAEKLEVDLLMQEVNKNIRISESMIGNALEALIGAIYLEKGYKKTKLFVIKTMLQSCLDLNEIATKDDNYKSQILEYCQKYDKRVQYILVDKFKENSRDKFTMEVVVDGKQMAKGTAYSKKAAEQLASKTAFQKLLNQST